MKLSKECVKNYVLGGKATVTVQSSNTGQYYTYRVLKADKITEYNAYYIYYLHGPDNTKDYRYIGIYFPDTPHYHPVGDYKDIDISGWPIVMRVFKYFIDRIDNVPSTLNVYHNGKCGRCGRKLTTPESIERGLGPECYKRSKL